MGDFNTKFHAKLEGEEEIMGEHVFGRGIDFLTKGDKGPECNRYFMCEMLRENELVVMNSMFRKEDSKK